MSILQDKNPEQGFDPYEALGDLDGAERTSLERFLLADEAVTFGVNLIDRIEPDNTPAPINNDTAERIAGIAREASNKADTLQAEAISKHTKAVDEHAEPGYEMLKKAGEDYQPLVQNQTPAEQIETNVSTLHPDVLTALDGWGSNSNDNYMSGAN